MMVKCAIQGDLDDTRASLAWHSPHIGMIKRSCDISRTREDYT